MSNTNLYYVTNMEAPVQFPVLLGTLQRPQGSLGPTNGLDKGSRAPPHPAGVAGDPEGINQRGERA